MHSPSGSAILGETCCNCMRPADPMLLLEGNEGSIKQQPVPRLNDKVCTYCTSHPAVGVGVVSGFQASNDGRDECDTRWYHLEQRRSH